MKSLSCERIALFASGNGSNAENIMNYFQNSEKACISLLISNKADAFALQRAKKFKVPTGVFSNEAFKDGSDVLQLLRHMSIDRIVLAGFLRKIPHSILSEYPNAIVNIHPALLPDYGGKGMYGMHVHRSVIADRQQQSGITIHLVNEFYDDGQILFQAICPVEHTDTPEILAEKVHQLEFEFFPKVIEDWICNVHTDG